MKKNALIVGAVVIIVLAGILLFVRAPQAPAPVLSSPEANPAPVAETPAPETSPTPTPSINPNPILGEAPVPNPPPPAPAPPVPPPNPPPGNTTITITDASFSPATITVKKGTTVVFKNQSSGTAWPASDPHPTHTEYPAQGGCAASAFDACRGIPPGASWSFIFDVSGTWDYHDHRNPLREGTVVVQ